MAAGARRSCAIDLPDGRTIDGDVTVPDRSGGLVIFAHGSGSSRLSPRNRSVAEYLNGRGLATLLMDLLTRDEDQRDRSTREHRFDIGLLGRRVLRTIDWADGDTDLRPLPFGCFGASTGAAAALVAAAERPQSVRAVVSRGGRPDLAGDALVRVAVPVLLLVGGEDHGVMELNAEAATQLAQVDLRVVPGAGHLFEEAGTMDQVQAQAADWFLRWLPGGPPGAPEELDAPP
jgi:putative phosphoribosyl transferase